jgi:hypothetical protein
VVLLLVAALLHVLVMIGDRLLLPVLVGGGLKMVTVVMLPLVLQLHMVGGRSLTLLVLVGRGLLVVVVLLVVVLSHMLELVVGHTLSLVGRALQLFILVLVLVLLLACGTLHLLMPVHLGGMLRLLVVVSGNMDWIRHFFVGFGSMST